MNPEKIISFHFFLSFFREFRHFIKPHFHKMDSVKRATGKWRMCVCHWDDSWKNLTLFHSTPSITTANELKNKIRFSFSFSHLINRIIRRPFPYSLSPVSNPMRFINRAHQFNQFQQLNQSITFEQRMMRLGLAHESIDALDHLTLGLGFLFFFLLLAQPHDYCRVGGKIKER